MNKELLPFSDAAVFFRTLVEGSSDAMYILDPEADFRFVYVNQATTLHFGVSKEKLLASTVYDFDPEMTREKGEAMWQVLLTDKVLVEKAEHFAQGQKITTELTINLLSYQDKYYAVGIIRDISKQTRQTEKLLMQAQLLENINDVILLVSEKGMIEYANQQACEAFSLPSSTLDQLPLSQFFGDEVLEGLKEKLQDYHTPGMKPVYLGEFIAKIGDESRLLFDMHAGLLTNFAKQAYFIIAKDISTERKQEQWLKDTHEVGLIGTWEFDLALKKASGSKELYDMLGLALHGTDLLSQLNRLIIQTPYTEQFVEAVDGLLATGKPFEIDLPLFQTPDSTQWIRVMGHRNWHQSMQKIHGTIQDITKEKEAEVLLKQKQALYEQLVNQLKDILIIANTQGQLLYVSPSIEETLGYPPQEFINDPMLPNQVLHPESAEAFQDFWNYYGEHQRFKEAITLTWIHKKGRAVHIEHYVSNIYDEQGKVIGFQALGRDITEQKKAAQTLKEQNDRLNKVNQELDNFVYRVSHDLRAPVLSALGLISVIKMEMGNHSLDAQKLDDYIAHQEKSLLKLDLFIREILDYSRNSRVQVQAEQVNVTFMIREIIDQMAYLGQGKPITSSIHIQQRADFFTDIYRLKVILSNLLSNSIRFADPNKPKLAIKVSGVIKEDWATLRIRDNGVGISKGHGQKIFDMFYRATDRHPGSGLGLYIVKEALDKLHGNIDYYSNEGEFTEFVVNLPNLFKA